MALISVDHVSKAFKIPKVQPGLTGSIKSLFHREYDVRQPWMTCRLHWKRVRW